MDMDQDDFFLYLVRWSIKKRLPSIISLGKKSQVEK